MGAGEAMAFTANQFFFILDSYDRVTGFDVGSPKQNSTFFTSFDTMTDTRLSCRSLHTSCRPQGPESELEGDVGHRRLEFRNSQVQGSRRNEVINSFKQFMVGFNQVA